MLLNCEANYCFIDFSSTLLDFIIVVMFANPTFSYSIHHADPCRFPAALSIVATLWFPRSSLISRFLHPHWNSVDHLFQFDFPRVFLPTLLCPINHDASRPPISSASFLFLLLCIYSLRCYSGHIFSFFLFFLSQKSHLLLHFGCLSTVGNSQINISKSNLLLLTTNINFEVACLGSLSCWLLKVTESKTEIILPINHDAFLK